MTMAVMELNDDMVRSMAVGAVFSDYVSFPFLSLIPLTAMCKQWCFSLWFNVFCYWKYNVGRLAKGRRIQLAGWMFAANSQTRIYERFGLLRE